MDTSANSFNKIIEYQRSLDVLLLKRKQDSDERLRKYLREKIDFLKEYAHSCKVKYAATKNLRYRCQLNLSYCRIVRTIVECKKVIKALGKDVVVSMGELRQRYPLAFVQADQRFGPQ